MDVAGHLVILSSCHFSMSKHATPQAQTEQDQSTHPSEPVQKQPASSQAAPDLQTLQGMAGNSAVSQLIAGKTADGSAAAAQDGLRTPGQKLDPTLRTEMETHFGEDFGDVQVHTDAASAQALDARAYTVGQDIVLGGEEALSTSATGKQLLAHELTHVVQQRQRGNADPSARVSQPSDTAEHEAEGVAHTVARGERAPAISVVGKGIQRDVGWAKRGPLPDPYGNLTLLNAFAGKFLEAAKLIFKNPAAMKLVNEAEAAGVQFGGYAEEGPGKTLGRAYTSGTSVYVPKTQTDPIMAMRDFLFELNNALRAPKFAALTQEATKGSKGTLTAKDYAYKMAEQEVEGMLRLGSIWFETKKTMPKGAATDAYDPPFFLSDYQAVKDGKKTKDDVVKDVLKRVYDTGTLKGKTVEQYYMEAYARVSGGK